MHSRIFAAALIALGLLGCDGSSGTTLELEPGSAEASGAAHVVQGEELAENEGELFLCCSLWNLWDVPRDLQSDEVGPRELGMKFRAQKDGYVKAIRFFRGVRDRGPHTGSLWSEDGTRLAHVTFPNSPWPGWRTVMLPEPIAVRAGEVHVVSFHTGTGRPAVTRGLFSRGSVVRGPLEALADGVAGANGVRRVGASGFPDEAADGNHYGLDVYFVPADIRAPELVITSPASAERVSGQVIVEGTAIDDGQVAKVEVQIDDGPRMPADGTTAWRFEWDTTEVEDGFRQVKVIAVDTRGNAAESIIEVEVVNAQPVWTVEPLVVDRTEVGAREPLTAEIRVRNDGTAAGEVLRLSVTATHGTGEVRELSPALTRVEVQPGDSLELAATLEFTPFDPLGAWTLEATFETAEGVTASAPVEVQRIHVVPLSTAIHRGRLNDDPSYRQLFLQRFDGMTPEYEMKMTHVQPQRGVFNFAITDELVNFAEQNGKTIRGHTLVWHNSLPSWLTGRTWTRDELIAVMQHHIATVVGRYKGRIQEWDVVNEALNDNGTWRSTIWFNVIGPDYVALAFEAAHAADPDARLFYNDFNADRMNSKSTAIYNMVLGLKNAGVPIHGVGMQAHQSTTYNSVQMSMEPVIERLGAIGIETQVTEMDVKVAAASHLSTADKLQLQADIYSAAATACQAQPTCTRFSVWGPTDKYTWLGSAEMPLLFDTNYQPKPSWYAVAAALGR